MGNETFSYKQFQENNSEIENGRTEQEVGKFQQEVKKAVENSKEICKSHWTISKFPKRFATTFPKFVR